MAGLTGVAGLAAVSGAAGVAGASGLDGVNDRLEKAAQQFIVEGGRATGDDNGGQDPGRQAPGGQAPDGQARGGQEPGGSDGKSYKGDEWVVPCDADELIAALVLANAGNGATLKLAERCTYTLTAFAPVATPPTAYGPNGLPVIIKPITIKGEGATIVRAANAEAFRILEVGVGGDLRLRDITIKGGSASIAGGGGIRVDAGGEATLEHLNVVDNRSSGSGGGIANFGITKITGKTDHGKDSATSGTPKSDAPSNGPAAQSPEGQGAAAELSAENAGTGRNWDDKDKGGYEGNETRISNNTGTFNGGGIHNNGYLTMENARVSANVIRGTGGTVITGSGGGLSNSRVAVINDVRIDHNIADFRGGGVHGGLNSTTTVTNADVSENTASSEGGGIFSDGDFHLKHSKIDRNSVFQRGGGIFNQIGQLVITDSKISENTVRNEGGGGIYVGSGTVVLSRSHVDRNKAVGPDSLAGGIYNRGTLSLTESKVVQNDAALPPGGIFTENNQVTVDQKSLIIKNRPTNCTGSAQPVPNCFG
ncbi:hypothetical protein [Micromonospora parathelypteridis]|uniref:Right-handed parallel beta-helix repeat-containing protein n=1 Tax=Micromonospora parathelypteridis TaxID=1839617 RepID=A0A840WEA5_9ACTN|nr:hypothetical protein [Micromonospora parathelypteridis]MBB5481321.1 hypothetical protein [Micromonospora parathelypteridis]GGO19073.1 hypothetical protein GCM10011576_34750 [Micromonospora parathelypteridis]